MIGIMAYPPPIVNAPIFENTPKICQREALVFLLGILYKYKDNLIFFLYLKAVMKDFGLISEFFRPSTGGGNSLIFNNLDF